MELSNGQRMIGDELTRSALLHLLRRRSKNRQYFGHDLRHYIHYRCSRRDFCVSLEAGEEAFDPVEEFGKRFAACGSILCRLWKMCYHSPAERSHNKTHNEENTDSRKYYIDGREYLKMNVRSQIGDEATC